MVTTIEVSTWGKIVDILMFNDETVELKFGRNGEEGTSYLITYRYDVNVGNHAHCHVLHTFL